MKTWRPRIVAVTITGLAMIAVGSPATAADPPPGSLEMTVTYVRADNTTESANFASVRVINQTTGTDYTAGLKSSTASSSTFRAESLPIGRYKVLVSGGVGLFPQWWPSRYTQAAAGTFEVTANAICDGTSAEPCAWHRFTAQLNGARTISGRVAGRSGQGASGATVSWERNGESGYRGTTLTNASGHYTISIPSGTYTVSAPNGGRRASATATVTGATASVDLTLLDPPSAPRDVQAVEASRKATVTWLPPTDDGGTPITGYRVISTPQGKTCTTTGTECQVVGLDNNTTYTFRVQAENPVGPGTPSATSNPITPAANPAAPRNVQARAGNRQLVATWDAPSDDGGSPITQYVATAWPGGRTCVATAPARDCAITSLTNGTAYTVTVTAENKMGVSERSPGAAQVTPKASKAAASAKLKKVSQRRGKITVRWKVTGATRARLSWRTLPNGSREHKITRAAGKMTLKGKRGTRFKVSVRPHTAAGKKAAAARVFKIKR